MSKKRRKKANENELTRHHIVPSSRDGGNHHSNIALVQDKKHKAYHIMFSNMTPDEIIRDLVENYWDEEWGWVAKAIKEVEL